ncbi:hypothetical protein [Bdellovibrio bacteriovorus]|uniref:hypothetical protein n=1 Tax=Bdellovibrio bacteriovorus TaxID=959 RepID=UPI0035A6827E
MFVFILSACSERELQIGFLNKALSEKSEFKITNVQGTGDMLPDAANEFIPFEITCNKAVTSFEIQNAESKAWKKVSELVAGATFDCAATGTVSLQIPLQQIVPFSAPTSAGDQRKDFQIRWMVKNLEGETSVYYRTLSAFFKAPTVTVAAPNASLANAANGQYVVTGTCAENGGRVEINAEFLTSAFEGTCTDNGFSIPVSVNTSTPEKISELKVAHMIGTNFRAYGVASTQVTVDFTAPVVTFTEPSSGKIFTSVDFVTVGTVHLAGTCSETMKAVAIELNGASSLANATCSAAGTFAADVVVPEGPFTLTAKQADDAGNEGASLLLSLEKDTTGPGSFSISGVRSSDGPADVAIDDLLTDKGLRVDLSSSNGAATYEVMVKDAAGVTVCPMQSTTNSYVIFTSCVLLQNTSYRIYAQAKDANGNGTSAGQNPFTFTTQFPVPVVTRVTTPMTASTRHGGGATITIYAEYDRPITLTGDVKVLLNTGEYAFSAGLVGDRVIKFIYIVPPNKYAAPLNVQSTEIELNGATIKDGFNNEVLASRTLPNNSSSNPNSLASQNITIDSQPPLDLTSFSLSAVPTRVIDSPLVNFTLPADPDVLTVTGKLVRVSDNFVVSTVTDFTTGSGFAIPQGNVVLGAQYRIEIVLADSLGNTTTNSQLYTSFQCPADFVYVFNPAAPAVDPFCVAKFEAKNTLGSPKFTAAGTPISNVTLQVATEACSSLGAGYRLINNQEWNTLADWIRSQAANWTYNNGGVYENIVEKGVLQRGNNQVATPAAAVETDPCYPNSASICQSNALRRTHHLPYGQVIWDIAGNVSEVTYDTDGMIYSPASGWVAALISTAGQLRSRYGTLNSCTPGGSPDYCGYGKLDFTLSGPVIWRGGSGGDGNAAGVFTAVRDLQSNQGKTTGGFRCVYNP